MEVFVEVCNLLGIQKTRAVGWGTPVGSKADILNTSIVSYRHHFWDFSFIFITEQILFAGDSFDMCFNFF